uniref:Ig-like domain-containing protein n=1 Tax=Pygocentrus nattereri TaxID=42514 RepID=A0A3B4CYB0_PYGNA
MKLDSEYSAVLQSVISFQISHVYSTQAVRHSEPLVISAEPGEAVNLTCTFVDDPNKDVRMWYKQRLEHAPLELGSQLEGKSAVISDQLDKSRFKLNKIASGISLSIERITKEDEGMYFCGASGKKTLDFSTATFLAVTVQWSVSPGESVTLQCTVLSEIRAADLRVLWFRAAAGQSFPEIIYTHQNSSSRQCEISSSTNCSLYEFSKNILDQHHTGTYYCAVAACGKIIFGNGTSVELSNFLLVCVLIYHIGHIVFLWCLDENAEELNYAALNFHERKTKRGRGKREQPQEDTLYSAVRGSSVNDCRVTH